MGVADRGHAQGEWKYNAVGKPLWSEAEGRTRLEDLGDGQTRVHFSETYRAFNPIMRVLLEKRVHDFISKDNDRLIKDSLTKGVQMMRAARTKGTSDTPDHRWRLLTTGARRADEAAAAAGPAQLAGRSASAAARARNALPRCEMACLSSEDISANVSPPPSAGTKTGSYPKPPLPWARRAMVPSTTPSAHSSVPSGNATRATVRKRAAALRRRRRARRPAPTAAWPRCRRR